MQQKLTKCAGAIILQIPTILLQNATVITKCHVYYKWRHYKEQQRVRHSRIQSKPLLLLGIQKNKNITVEVERNEKNRDQRLT